MTSVETDPVERSGDWVQTAPGLQEIDFSRLKMKVDADRYLSQEFAERERERIWNRVWQVVCRVDDLPNAGDWKEYKILDRSYLVVRGADGVIRGLVNACRHRGNVMCVDGKGNTGRRFTCPYHLWSYDLEGKLRGVSHPELVGEIDKGELGLFEVAVDTFAGFVFLNPDPDAGPLAEFLGESVLACMEPYHLDEMVTVLDVREAIECNWKIVVDAFQEGYHIQGIHPELLQVIVIDPYSARFNLSGDHVVSCAPFQVPNADPEDELTGLRDLPTTFPTVAGYLPRLEELVDAHRGADGKIEYPEGVTGRTLLQHCRNWMPKWKNWANAGKLLPERSEPVPKRSPWLKRNWKGKKRFTGGAYLKRKSLTPS